jgi:hypothetical protein
MPQLPQQGYTPVSNTSTIHELGTTIHHPGQADPAELGVGGVVPEVYELNTTQQIQMASELEGSGRPTQRLG